MIHNKFVLNVGHGYESTKEWFDSGACAKGGHVCEYDWNEDFVKIICNMKDQLNGKYPYDIVVVYQKSYYTLADDINNIECDGIISFHLNAFTEESATGTEMLYCDGSGKGHLLADYCYTNVQATLQLKKRYNPVRGLKYHDRGGGLLHSTHKPHIISEAFFISNPNDLQIGNQAKYVLAKNYLDAIYRYYVMLESDGVYRS